jgi:peroxiredoxin
MGIQPVAISADSPNEIADMCRKAGLTYPVLSDYNLDAINHYDLKIAEKAQDGHEAGGPGEFLIDPAGTIRWRKLIETHPPEILAAAKVLQ